MRGNSTCTHAGRRWKRSFQEVAETQPELLAHHYTEVRSRRASHFHWHRAGQRTVERSANVEAISHFTKGLELLKALPYTPGRVRRTLALQLALGPPLLMLKAIRLLRWNTPTRAYTLAQQLGEAPQRFSVL